MSRTACTLFFCVLLVSAAALAQQTQAPMPAPLASAKTTTPEEQKSAAKNVENPAAKIASKVPMRGQPEESTSPGSALPSQGSAWISPPPPASTASVSLAYPATSSETASRVEDLLRDAAALRGQGNLTKAMELYNEALALAPQYAETYRQRAMTLLRLGDSVQAQIDYGRFLALDPQARARVRDEIQLFSQSGYARVGETEVALSAGQSAFSRASFARAAFARVFARGGRPARRGDCKAAGRLQSGKAVRSELFHCLG